MPLSLIPQIFFDLIARIAPGFASILLITLSIAGPEKVLTELTKSTSPNYFSVSVILLVASYLFGFVLTYLWGAIIENPFKKKVAPKIKKYTEEALTDHAKVSKILVNTAIPISIKDLPAVHEMHNQIRNKSESEGYRLLKIRGEVRLCQNIVIGTTISFFLNLFYGLLIILRSGTLFYIADRINFAVLLVALGFIFYRSAQKYESIYSGGTIRAWLLLRFPFVDSKKTKEK